MTDFFFDVFLDDEDIDFEGEQFLDGQLSREISNYSTIFGSESLRMREPYGGDNSKLVNIDIIVDPSTLISGNILVNSTKAKPPRVYLART